MEGYIRLMSDYIEIEVKEHGRIFSIRKEHINSVTMNPIDMKVNGKDMFRVCINSSGLCTNEEFDSREKAFERYSQIMGMLNS